MKSIKRKKKDNKLYREFWGEMAKKDMEMRLKMIEKMWKFAKNIGKN